MRASLEALGYDVDEMELAIMRVADALYGPKLRALAAADLTAVWPEPESSPHAVNRTVAIMLRTKATQAVLT